jgi:hypothetical protein
VVFEVLRSSERPDEPGSMVIFHSGPDGSRGEIICLLPESIGEQLRAAIEADTDRMIRQALEATCERIGSWFGDQARMRAGLPLAPLDFSIPLPARLHVMEPDSPSAPSGDPLIDHVPGSLRPW